MRREKKTKGDDDHWQLVEEIEKRGKDLAEWEVDFIADLKKKREEHGEKAVLSLPEKHKVEMIHSWRCGGWNNLL